MIRNKVQLIRNGGSAQNQKARRFCLHALEHALAAANPDRCLRSRVRVEDKRILVDKFSIPLSQFRRIMLLAVGKASVPMMKAAVDILKGFAVSGILIAPEGVKLAAPNDKIETFRAGHPFPNMNGFKAAERTITVISTMHENELLLCLISGGASAMLPAPPSGITLNDKRKVTEKLLRSGATAGEINTVRRHLSNLKGGRLVEYCRASTIISLILSDNPRNYLWDIASGPTAEDPTSYKDAVEILKSYNLWDSIPARIKHHVDRGLCGEIPETPKPGNPVFQKVHNFIIADNGTACSAAKSALQAAGVPAIILTSSAELEARSMGKLLASTAIGWKMCREPGLRPRALIVGGETTVEVGGKGTGGRNQETALSAVEEISNLTGTAIAALGTDGVDGNSGAAGAIVDGSTAQRARLRGMNPLDFLRRNDSYRFFRRLNDNLVTGPTGTNVADVYITVSVD